MGCNEYDRLECGDCLGCDRQDQCNGQSHPSGLDQCSGHDHSIEEIVKEYHASREPQCNLFENPVFYELFDGIVRPGGLKLTQQAMELCNFDKGAKILDIGCGYGATVEFLQSKYGVDATGIDLSTTMLERGKERNPKLSLQFGDAEMLDFPSLSFDGVFMECVLSLTENVVEALHEAYCVLKNGGKLIISDFYRKEPGKISQTPIRCQGSCSHAHTDGHGDHAHHAHEHEHKEQGSAGDPPKIKTCLDGAFDAEELKSTLFEIGFQVLSWEDRSKELKEFTATLIMHFGSLDAFYKSVMQDGNGDSFFSGIDNHKKLGYFLMVAEKK